MLKTMKIDGMLTDKPLKSIIKFMIPIFIGNLFQQLYAMVDTIIVGQTLSSQALAGVGATGALSFLLVGFIQGMTAGYAVLTSQRFGANDENGIKKSVAISFVLSAVFTVLLTLISVFCAMPLLKLMRTPGDIIGFSYDYIIVIFAGLFATAIYNVSAAILRAVGDSRTQLVFLIIASILNVGLDLLFIIVFKTGVAGAGIATVLSQGLSGIACVIYMFVKFPVLRVKAADFKLSVKLTLKHLAVAMPMAFQFSIIAVGIMIQQFALNRLGSVIVTAYTAAYKIDQLAVQILLSLGMALAVYCGQNYGAYNLARIKTGVNKTALLSVFFALAVGAFVIFAAEPMTRLFIAGVSDEILANSQEFLFYQGVFYIMLSCIFVYRNALQGMGRSGLTMAACIVELGMRIVASLVMAKYMGFTGICLSNPVAWIGATVLLVAAYYITVHKMTKSSWGSAEIRNRESLAQSSDGGSKVSAA